MNTRPDKPNDDKLREELRQQLWELAYGLLEPQEETALIARVKSDPAIARLYAEVKLQTNLVSTAARVEDSSLSISSQGAGAECAVGVNQEKRFGSKSSGASSGTKSSRAVPAAKANGGAWGTNWLAVAGTTALLLLLGYGLWQPQTVTHSVAQGEYYYTRVTGLVAMTEGITQKVGVEYKDIHDNGRAAKLEVRVVDPQGHETYRTTVRTASDGRGEVDLPGVVVKKGVRLEVSPAADRLERDRQAEVVSTELQVADEKRKTVLLTERPYAAPGQSNRFQMFGVGEYSKTITAPPTDELMVENQTGGDVVQPMWTVDPANGVISGEYELPPTYSAKDSLNLRRRSLAKEQAEGSADKAAASKFAEGGSLGGADALAEQTGRRLDRVASALRQADGEAAKESLELQRGANGIAKAGLMKSNNAERDANSRAGGAGSAFGGGGPGTARSFSPAGAAPVAPPAPRPENAASADEPQVARKNAAAAPNAAQVPTPAPATVPADKPLADVAPGKPGAAPALNAPAPPAPSAESLNRGGQEQQQKDARQLAKQEQGPAPADPVADPKAALRMEEEKLSGPAELKRVSESRKELGAVKAAELNVPAELKGEDLVLIARATDGRVVARKELAAHEKPDALVDLPPEVDGLVDIEFFRKGESQAPVARQQLVRASSRALNFDVAGLKDSYAPGEKVQLAVRVLDENGRPAAGAFVGVRVWNEVAARAASSPLLLVDSLSRADLAFREAVEKPVALAATAPVLQQELKAQILKSKVLADPLNPAPGAPATEVAPESPSPPSAELAKSDFAPPAVRGLMQNNGVTETQLAPFALSNEAAEAEVFFVDNRSLVQQEHDRALAIQEMQHAEQRQAFGRILLWSGAGLMLLVGVLLISRRPLKSAVWIPAVGLAALSLGLGVAWFLPPQRDAVQLAKALPVEVGVEPQQALGTLPLKSPAENVDTKSAPAPAPERALKQFAELPDDAPPPPVIGAPQDGVADRPGFAGDRGKGGGGLAAAAPDQAAEEKATRSGDAKLQAGVDAQGGQPAAKKANGDRAERERSSGGYASEQLPDSLFWRPLSAIENDGTFTIEFTMPAAESDYRLLIDAIGSGRIGGKEEILRCREE